MECKLIEVMHNSQMLIHQQPRVPRPIRMSKSKDSGMRGNSSWKLSQLITEYELPEGMNSLQRQIRPD
jgi:hypothetical protein